MVGNTGKIFGHNLDQLKDERIKAIKGFKNDVDGNKYPNKNHTISMNDGELEQLIKALNK